MSIYDKSSLVLIPSGTKTSKVYSQKPTNGDGDFDFTRSTAATRVNADGNIEKETMNLMPYSNNFSQWSPKNGTFAQGVSDPFGGNNAWSLTATNADPYLYLNPSVTGLVTLSVWAKGVGSSIGKDFLLISSGSSPNNSAHILTSEWVRYEGYFNCTSPVQFGFEIPNPAVVGDVVHIYGAQLEYGLVARDYIETTTTALYGGITDNVPRLDYTDSSCPALLLEPQRTNILANSELLSDFTKTNITEVSGNQVTPEGVLGSIKISPTSSASVTQISKVGLTIGIAYSLSFFVKAAEASNLIINQAGSSSHRADYNISNLTTTSSVGITANIKSYGNNWVRVEYITSSLTYADIRILLSDGSANYPYSPPVGEGLYLWGFQLEAGSYATSYIPTYGTSVTRVGDDARKTSIGSLLNNTEGTLFAEYIRTLPVTAVIFQLSIGNNTNRVQIENQGGSNGKPLLVVSSGGSTQAVVVNPVGIPLNEVCKVAVTYKQNEFKLYVNGVLTGTDTSGAVPTSLTAAYIGSEAGTPYAGFKVNQLLYIPSVLTDQEVIDLTTI